MLGDKGYPTSFASATEVGYYTIDDRLTNEDTPNGHRAYGEDYWFLGVCL